MLLMVASALVLALTAASPTPSPTAAPKVASATPQPPKPTAQPTAISQPTPIPQPSSPPQPSVPPPPAPTSHLPATQPGLGADEGVFLLTDADDGGQVVYFIAQGARHAMVDGDLQLELRVNPLWPYRAASRDEVLAFPEGAAIGAATAGRLSPERVEADEPESVAADASEALADAPDANGPDPDSGVTYTVQRGDTLIGIAARFGVTEDDLLAHNTISNRNRIYAGQVLTIG